MQFYPRFEFYIWNIAVFSMDCELQSVDADYKDHWQAIGLWECPPIRILTGKGIR